MPRFHLIAPSSYCINQQAVLRRLVRPTEADHQIDNSAIIACRCRRFTGTEAEKLADVNSLANLKTPGIIVMAVRGNYSTSRLLAEIDWQGLTVHQQRGPLLLCRHNDSMTIQCGLLVQGNAVSLGGSMPVANLGAEEINTPTEYHFWQTLCNAQSILEWQGEGPQYATEGALWGENLAMIISLMSTPWMPAIKNGILVLEDINEHPFRVERMLLQLYHVGALAQQNAIILGSFSGSTPNDYGAGYNLDSVCDFLCAKLSIPLICNLDFGHGQRTATLPLGASAVLKNDKNGTQFTLSGHPVLKS